MSKFVYICFNNKKLEERLSSDRVMELLSKRLTPDNISSNPVKIIKNNGVLAGIINPVNSVLVKDRSICLGVLLKPYDNWYIPLTDVPDGNYALVRGSNNTIEAVSDVVASRTIWYYFDKDLFIVSTSQRAIVIILRSFSFNNSVVPWMISSGMLGYENSWDTRIKILKADCRLVLDRKSWEIKTYEKPVIFKPDNFSNKQAFDHMLSVYEDTFARLDLISGRWLMALSGGHDSRLVFLMLKDKIKFQCVSWGVKEAINEKLNDAYIAKKLAEYYGFVHNYYEVETKKEFIKNSLTRLLLCGEGRTDHIHAYMDAFNSWKKFFEMGVTGIFRGDQGYIRRAILSEEQGRQLERIKLLKDFKDYYKLSKFRFASQEISNDLKKRNGESLVAYSFRLHHMYRLPYVTAAWTDIVSPYTEVINPILTRNIIYEIRKLPYEYLYMKTLHKNIVENISPDIKFANKSADEPISKIMYNPELIKFIYHQIDSNRRAAILDDEFISYVLKNLNAYETNNIRKYKVLPYYFKTYMKKMVSKKNKQKMKAYIKSTIDYNEIALRCYIILSMYNILNEDADILNNL